MTMTYKKLIKLALFSALLFLISFSFAFAQRTQLNYPQFPGVRAWAGGLADFLRYIYQILLVIGAILAFGFFVFGGFLYLTSFGNPGRMGKAKEIMTSALLGLFILFASYAILSTIDPSLVIFNLHIFQFTLPSLPAKHCSDYDNLSDCEAAGCYWYRGTLQLSPTCHSEPPNPPGCYKIPLQDEFETIHNLEKEALLLGSQIESLIFGFPGQPSKLIEIIQKIIELTKQCDCSRCGDSVCIKPDSGCPECPAYCPPTTDPNKDPCPPDVKDQINELLEEAREQGFEVDTDLISLLEDKIRKLTEARLDFEKYRREVIACRQDKNRQLFICSEAKDKTFREDLECKELDFYCCP